MDDDAAARSHKAPRRITQGTLYVGCLGKLGQFGNQLFQYAFAIAYAEAWKLQLRTPPWMGALVFESGHHALEGPPIKDANERLILADRVILSHAGWKQWVEQREPLACVVRDSGGGTLSGRKLRQHCPQVNAEAIAADRAKCACVRRDLVAKTIEKGGTIELWGFFQMHTASLAMHRRLIERRLRPLAAVRRLVETAVGRVRSAAAMRYCVEPDKVTLVCIHVRCCEDVLPMRGGASQYEPCTGNHAGADTSWRLAAEVRGTASDPASGAPASGAEASGAEASGAASDAASWGGGEAHVPSMESPTGLMPDLPSEWRDEGVFWAAPAEWYVTWLRWLCARLCAPAVLLCTDDAQRALDGPLAEFAPALLPGLVDAESELWRAAHACTGGQLTEGALLALCDWEAMRTADLLAINQSTFSFSAAMAAPAWNGVAERLLRDQLPQPPESQVRQAGNGAIPRWWRPDPATRTLVAFDPWDAQVLLNACESGTHFRRERERDQK